MLKSVSNALLAAGVALVLVGVVIDAWYLLGFGIVTIVINLLSRLWFGDGK